MVVTVLVFGLILLCQISTHKYNFNLFNDFSWWKKWPKYSQIWLFSFGWKPFWLYCNFLINFLKKIENLESEYACKWWKISSIEECIFTMERCFQTQRKISCPTCVLGFTTIRACLRWSWVEARIWQSF